MTGRSMRRHHVMAKTSLPYRTRLARLGASACVAAALVTTPAIALAEDGQVDEVAATPVETAAIVQDEATVDAGLPVDEVVEAAAAAADETSEALDVATLDTVDDATALPDDSGIGIGVEDEVAPVEAAGDAPVADEGSEREEAAAPAETAEPAEGVAGATDEADATDEAVQDAAPEQLSTSIESQWAGGHWDVRLDGGKLQRFWVSKTGEIYKNGLVRPEWGAGYYAWAQANGWIVRGIYSDGTYVWLADNNGKLANPGWLVSNVYGQGLQRYYIVDDGVHAARIGYNPGNGSSVWAHYTTEQGYVLRGAFQESETRTYLADNNGKLPTATGWLVTNAYGGKLQRYYIEDNAAKTGTFTIDGKSYLGLPGLGYVLRGYDATHLAYANNDGVLATNRWLVTNQFGHGTQRYWMGADGLAVRSALIDPALAGYRAYARPEGYVVRGKYMTGGRTYLANNDGKLEHDGWVVTAAYDGKIQRYYIDPDVHASVAGYSTDGFPHFTLSNTGYVARTVFETGGWVYFADNNGLLLTRSQEGWMVSNKYSSDGKLQRYYIEKTSDGAWAAKVGYSAKGYAHYTLSKLGYVIRTVTQDGDWVYLADNNGLLQTMSKEGWLITSKYATDGKLKRYYLEKTSDGAWAAKVGYSTKGYAHYTEAKTGYVTLNKTFYEFGTKKWYNADNNGKLSAITAGVATVIETYLAWALDLANDSTHGYSQIDRWGPADYDCSSMVVTALRQAGLQTGDASWTGNMRTELSKFGWMIIPYNGSVSSLVRGDILLHDQNHVEFYLGNGQRVGAHSDEYGGIGYGARPGDQTGEEICVRYSVGTWFTWVLRLRA